MENKPKYSAYGRPDDIDGEVLEKVRTDAMKKDLVGLGTEDNYLRESYLMNEWNCSCGITNIPCAQGECSCGNPRPAEWRDSEQGENAISDGHRRLADFAELRDVRL